MYLTEQQFHKIFNASPNALTVNSVADLRYIHVNDSFLKITGYRRDEIIGRKPEDLKLYLKAGNRDALRSLIAQRRSVSNAEACIHTSSGDRRDCLISAELVELSGEECVIMSINDITDLRRAEEQIRFQTNVLANVIDAIIAVDKDWRITYWNKSAERLYSYKAVEVLGRKLEDVVRYRWIKPADSREAYKSLKVKGSWRGESIHVKKSGEEIHVESSVSVIRDGNGSAAGYLAVIRDITGQKRAEEELRTLLLVDELTGLYNRRGFLTLAQHQLKIARRMNREMMLMFADVDGLKRINDTLGHLEGDRALADTAAILKETFRDPDIIARIGGDEFSVLVIEASRENMGAIGSRFMENLRAHNEKAKRPYKLSVSIGMAHYDPGQPCLINELLERADKSMYDQKHRGTDG